MKLKMKIPWETKLPIEVLLDNWESIWEQMMREHKKESKGKYE